MVFLDYLSVQDIAITPSDTYYAQYSENLGNNTGWIFSLGKFAVENLIYNAIKNLANGNVYPIVLPDTSSLPAIVYQRISSLPVNSLDGDSDLDSVRIQISVWANTYNEVKELSSVVRITLNDSVLKLVTENDTDDYEPETKRFRVLTDYVVWQK